MNPHASATQAYKESSVLTAPPERLVRMLYDGTLRFLARAAVALREGLGPAAANDPLKRADAILEELLSTLDHERGGELASTLEAIYAFSRRLLVEAQIEADADKVDQVAGFVRDLRDSWAQICIA